LHESKNKFSLPIPDYIAVNGNYNKRMLLNAKMHENHLINVEALRYEYLHAFSSDKNLIMNSSKNLNLLVLGDYLYNNTDEMISILKSSNYLLNSNINICFKPHPSCDYPIKQKLNNQKITISRTHLSVLLGNADVVFTSSLTSASLDCFIFGSKLITIRSKSGLNLSPLREVNGISVVSTSEEFDEAFAFYLNNSQSISENKINDFFYQDPNLSRWKKLLQL
jgi:surface carbohydrate biosynthesis protein (TIGR04326 family)